MTATPAVPTGSVGAHPAPVRQSKVSTPWTGIVMIIGAVIAVVGAFLTWEKIDIYDDGGDFFGGFTLSALTRSTSGQVDGDALAAGGAGKTLLAAAAVLLVTGVLIALKKGRLWASIVGLLFALAALGVGAGNFGAAESDGKDLLNALPEGFSVEATRDMGVLITTVGAGIAVVGALIALIKRRPAA